VYVQVLATAVTKDRRGRLCAIYLTPRPPGTASPMHAFPSQAPVTDLLEHRISPVFSSGNDACQEGSLTAL